MTPTCFNVEPIKLPDRLTIADHHSIDFATFSLANRTPHRAGEATEHVCRIAAQVECMPVKPARRGWRKLKYFASAYLKVMPSAFLREDKEPISNYAYDIGFKYQRLTGITKRQADTASSGEGTSYFHQRDKCRQSSSVEKLEIERLMFVCPVKHPCPTTRVKTSAVTMQSNNVVPSRVP